MSDDPYAILESARDASDAEIRAAYRRLAALFHPDRNPGFQDAATERLKQVNAAYEQVRSDRRRGSRADHSSEEAPPAEPGHRSRSGPPKTDGHRPPRDPDPATKPQSYRTRVAAMLTRVGFLAANVTAEDSVAVEVLATLMPPGSQIVACASYRDLKVTGSGPSLQAGGSFLRPLPTGVGVFGVGMPTAVVGGMPPTRLVLCTTHDVLWTSSHFASADRIVVEEMVTLHWLPLTAILGATVRPRGGVRFWVDDDGPTLTFRTTQAAGADLCAAVEAGARSV